MLSDAQIQDVALDMAAGMGDSQPTSIQYAIGTHHAAVLALSGDMVPGDDPVIAIRVVGQFTDDVGSPSSATDDVAGTDLTIIYDETTGEVSDIGVQSNAPALSVVGAVTSVAVP